jgi:hypothetical protein
LKKSFCRESGGGQRKKRECEIGVQLTRIRARVVVIRDGALAQLDAIYSDCGEECDSVVVETVEDDGEEAEEDVRDGGRGRVGVVEGNEGGDELCVSYVSQPPFRSQARAGDKWPQTW